MKQKELARQIHWKGLEKILRTYITSKDCKFTEFSIDSAKLILKELYPEKTPPNSSSLSSALAAIEEKGILEKVGYGLYTLVTTEKPSYQGILFDGEGLTMQIGNKTWQFTIDEARAASKFLSNFKL